MAERSALATQDCSMSVLSFVKFPYRMPDGFVPAEAFETKDLGFPMRWCEVSADGRLICEDAGDLNWNNLLTVYQDRRVYELVFDAGRLESIICYAEDGTGVHTRWKCPK
jgi:hypothetical protein